MCVHAGWLRCLEKENGTSFPLLKIISLLCFHSLPVFILLSPYLLSFLRCHIITTHLLNCVQCWYKITRLLSSNGKKLLHLLQTEREAYLYIRATILLTLVHFYSLFVLRQGDLDSCPLENMWGDHVVVIMNIKKCAFASSRHFHTVLKHFEQARCQNSSLNLFNAQNNNISFSCFFLFKVTQFRLEKTCFTDLIFVPQINVKMCICFLSHTLWQPFWN